MQKALLIFLISLIVYSNAVLMSKNRLRTRKTSQNTLQTASLSAGAVSSGAFTLTATIPCGNTAAAYQFLEGSTVVATGNLVVGNTNQLVLTNAVSGKTAGTYSYSVILWDANCGSVTSNSVSVTVPAAAATPTTSITPTPTTTSGAAWTVGVTYKAGNVVSYAGKNYKCVIGHTAIVSWEPTNATTLWTPA